MLVPVEPSSTLAIEVALGAALCVAGIATLGMARLGKADDGFRLGPIDVSVITVVVAGLSLLGIGYHVLAYALDWSAFRAPMNAVITVAGFATLLSAAADAFDQVPDEEVEDADDAGDTERSGR
ncbi:MAG: hypothetical protein AAGD00_03945 [Planctomycetota bacterium]